MTYIDRAELERLFDALNGLCDDRVLHGKTCDSCPCDANDCCSMSTIKELLNEHL
jgi:hypothetical protein